MRIGQQPQLLEGEAHHRPVCLVPFDHARLHRVLVRSQEVGVRVKLLEVDLSAARLHGLVELDREDASGPQRRGVGRDGDNGQWETRYA